MSQAAAILGHCHVRRLIARPGLPPRLEIDPLQFIPIIHSTKGTSND